MIALNPIKKDELSHTEPKLWNRRGQIETPTVFNNVEEIPDAIEKFCPLPRPPGLCARRRTVEGTLAMRNARTDPHSASGGSVAHISNLLSNDHLWHSHQMSSAESSGSFYSACWSTGEGKRGFLHGHTQTESSHDAHRCELRLAW